MTALAQAIPTDPKTGKTLWWCETKGGVTVCLPRFLEVAGWFKGVQRAVNAWLTKHPKAAAAVTVDARIGPTTVTAVNAALSAIGNVTYVLTTEQIAADVVNIATKIAQAAGVQPDFSPDPKPAPVEVQSTVPPETVMKAQEEQGSRKWIWWLVGGLAVAGVGIGAYVWYRRAHGQPVFAGAAEEDDDEIPPFRNVIDV